VTPLPAGWRMLVHDQLPSTADALRAAAEAGEPERLAILARRQTAGRGTHGRGWTAPEGNLSLSLLLRPGGPARAVPQWGLLVGVAVYEAIAPWAGPGLSLKWPNDLLLGGAKCCGMLSEAALDGAGGLEWLAFGIGVNLARAPDVPGRATAALPPPAVAPERAAAAIMAALDRWRAIHAAEGFGPVREAWLARGHSPGTPLTVTAPGGPLQGWFDGLEEAGALRLRTATGIHLVRAGDVDP